MPEITIQPAASAGIDTYLDESAMTTNRGTETTLQLELQTDGDNRDLMMKFDLSAIAKGSKIQIATLSLWLQSETGGLSGLGVVSISRILSGNSGWTEGGATWDKQDGSANWAGSNGAEISGVDYAVNPLWSGEPPVTLAAFSAFPLTVSEFQPLIDDANYGWKIWSSVRAPTVNRGRAYSSSDHGTAAQHPKLFVRWIEPSGRLFEYTFNKYDPQKRLFNSQGDIVEPNEIRPNNWIFTQGSQLPSGKVYSSLVPDPRMGYIVGVKNDEEGEVVSIETDRNQFADQILQRLTRGV